MIMIFQIWIANEFCTDLLLREVLSAQFYFTTNELHWLKDFVKGRIRAVVEDDKILTEAKRNAPFENCTLRACFSS